MAIMAFDCSPEPRKRTRRPAAGGSGITAAWLMVTLEDELLRNIFLSLFCSSSRRIPKFRFRLLTTKTVACTVRRARPQPNILVVDKETETASQRLTDLHRPSIQP